MEEEAQEKLTICSLAPTVPFKTITIAIMTCPTAIADNASRLVVVELSIGPRKIEKFKDAP